MNDESIFLQKWKTEVTKVFHLYFDKKGKKISEKKLNKYLDSVIKKNINNPEGYIINNYQSKCVKTDVLSVVDLIERKDLIIGGGGVMYLQHAVRDNPEIHFITNKMDLRKKTKGERKKYEKFSIEWMELDLTQLNIKILINSLYGAQGYPGFFLYNRFIAESVTYCGKQIISSATEGFESFLADQYDFDEKTELFNFINNILKDYRTKYRDVSFPIFEFDEPIRIKAMKRLIKKCVFPVTDDLVEQLEEITSKLSENELVLLYFKNNLKAFNEMPLISILYRRALKAIKQLRSPDLSVIDNPQCIEDINKIWDYYRIFVLYDHPIFDRVRKMMYVDKKAVLYIDTDSNFIGMNPYVQYLTSLCGKEKIQDLVNSGLSLKDAMKEFNFMCNSLGIVYVQNVAHAALQSLCRGMKVTEEWAKRLNMKNEFLMKSILFTPEKKRYISLSLLQEGSVLNNGNGLPEIKGFDFIKSTTKPIVKSFYEKICTEDILRSDEIKVDEIFSKIMNFKEEVRQSILNGKSDFFKQANVQIIEHYKIPYSNQGFTSVYLWNVLCPENQLELPIDVNIVPIVDLSKSKILEMLQNRYPEMYHRLDSGILRNSNFQQHFRTKNGIITKTKPITFIAKPKNDNIKIPDWFSDIINVDKIVQDTMTLIYPILQSLGLKVIKGNAKNEAISTIVDL